MMLTFTAQIHGRHIHCEIVSDTALARATFCFSLLAEVVVISGGTLVRSVAGYAEVALPDMAAGVPARVVIAYAHADFAPKNRAWLPLGAYLRVGGQTHALPDLPSGVTLGAQAATVAPFDGLPLIPQPQRWQPAGGMVRTCLACDDPQMQAVDDLGQRLGLPTLLSPAGLPCRVIAEMDMAEGTYVLQITDTAITITGGAQGVFYAGVTLLNLRATLGHWPCGTITDGPRFGWRGQHLDCARHFFGIDTILRLLDLMALFKLNRFHWHFADDEAFRLKIHTAPALWQKTEYRGEGCAVPGVFGGGIRAGGSYSAADVAQIIAHAAALQIDVLPEIEIPAHAFAMNKAVPGLRDPADNGAEVSVQCYRDNIINPAVPGTWALLEPLLDEIAGLFPMGMLHLGCDELPHGAWEGSPAVHALMAREGLASPDDVQGWMMARLGAHLAKKGVRAAAWEEAAKGANGGLGYGALLFSWTAQGPGIAAARAGYDVVVCPAQHVYFDMAHTADPDDWGATWATILPLEQTVNWQPVPVGAQDVATRIVGVQGCFWSEFTTADWQLEAMLCPRILGLANKAWDTRDSVDGAALLALAQAYAPVFDTIGWQRHGGALQRRH